MLKKKKHLDLQQLPEHVVLSILCRLPVKSLIRFTCVSKRWRSVIISDHQFGNSHFQLAASQLRHNVLISRSSPDYISEGTQFQSLEDNFSIKNLTCPFQRCSTIQVMGSCNGLVVLANFHPNVLSYWPCCLRDRYNILVMRNPSTGFFRKIPYPNFQIGTKKWTLEYKKIQVYYGFGQVSASDDYKLAVILNYGGFMEVRVFSVRANCWKVVKAPYLSPYRPWSEELGTYSNGAIHWVSLHEPGFLEPPVYAFDLANEEFREMPLPVLSHNEYGMKMTQTRTPVLLGGCLCVMFQDAEKNSEFWAMKEYGLPESWVKLFGFKLRDLPDVFNSFFSVFFWNPIFIAEDGTVVIKVPSKMEVIRFKCRKEEKPVCTDRYRLEELLPCKDDNDPCNHKKKYLFSAILYDETLVSIPE